MQVRSVICMLIVLALAGCKKDSPEPVSAGSFAYGGETYSVSMVRVEHVGYEGESYVLRLTAYPSTYKITEKSTSGYGAVLNLYFTGDANDFVAGGSYDMVNIDTLQSTLTFYPNTADGQLDTTVTGVESGTLRVEEVETVEFMRYTIEAETEGEDSVSGSYTGKHVHNRTAVQMAYGKLEFDTVRCELAVPTLRRWGGMFSDVNYSELVFYASDALFTDAGVLRQGVQFTVGLLTDTVSGDITTGVYGVTTDYYAMRSALYGHRVKSTAWGTYWQVYESGSAKGKANVTEGEVEITEVTEERVTAKFAFTDQLKNEVRGEYSGPYIIK